MDDMSAVIEPKSDQWNADDFIAGPRSFTIREVQVRGGHEQPVNILLDGSDKAYRPCKSMSRVLVQAWGPDSKRYVGKSLTLYRDPTVKWGGMEIGGIRISHMTDIDGKLIMQLTATKGQRKPHVVMPLVEHVGAEQQTDKIAAGVNALLARIEAEDDIAALVADPAVVKQRAWLAGKRPELAAKVDEAILAKQPAPVAAELEDEEEDPFGLPPLPPKHAATADPEDPAAELDSIMAQIAAAPNLRGLKAVDAEWLKRRGAYDDATAAQIDGLIAAKREELG